ncbi:PKD domain-containing protein [Fontimonas sp. SYSU GA230001]|uniref:PKD domain-containing protein n=1 Tax=Fontimonas sp. SYSU GA230001 TaxID=3142450 RepID=UPI0032B59287
MGRMLGSRSRAAAGLRAGLIWGLAGSAALLPFAARAACPLPVGAQVLHEWDVQIGPSAPVASSSTSAPEAFTLPAGCAASSMTVRIEWDVAANDLDLDVLLPSGEKVSAAHYQTSGQPVEEAAIPDPRAGQYSATVKGWLNAPTTVHGKVSVTITGDAQPGDGGGSGGGTPPAAIVSDPLRPRVIVADIDSGINPYHAYYYAGSEIYPNSAPSSVTQEVLDAFGVEPDNVVQLTRTGVLANDLAADAAFWSRVQRGKAYHFKGTNIIAISYAGTGLAPLVPTTAKSAHGVGTSSAVLRANPDAVIVFVETEGALGNDTAHEFAFLHPNVDIVTTSYGVSIPQTGFPLPETRAFHVTYQGVVEKGKLHFSSGGNGPGLTPLRAGAGPWWSIGVGGIEEDSSEGDTLISGVFPDFVSDFTQPLAYCMDCEAGTQSVGGTSFSTPRAAGVASRVLLEARRRVGHAGGIRAVDGGLPLMAQGKGFAISNWMLRRALEQAAWIPGLAEYDPVQGVFDLGGLPINPVAPWLQIAWGDLTAKPEKGVVPKALGHLNLGMTLNSKSVGYCDFQTAIIQERKLYWDHLAPFLPGVLGGDPTGNTPAQDPFIYCDSTLGQPAPNDSGGHPVDSDGDDVVDGIDNCPTVANASQADADADGIGDACDSDTGGGGGGNDPLAVTLSASHSKPANADGSYTVNGSDPLIVTFTAAASGGPDANYRYTFNFGDGSYAGPQSANSAQHSYAYANQDGYRVTVVVTDASATQSAVSNTILIRTTTQVIVTGNNGTVASLVVNPTSGTAPLTVTADATGSTHASGTVSTDYVFDFGEGAPVTNGSGTASHVYTVPQQQTYTVRVTVTDKDGSGAVLGSATATQDVVVNPGNRLTALLSVNPTTADVGQIITFDGCHSFAGDGHSITRYTLDPGDGTPVIVHDVTAPVSCANGHNDASVFQHAYGQGGSYTPTLTVYDETGAFAKASAGGVTIRTVPGPGTGGTSNSGVAPRRGGGALGWITLLPLALAGLRRRAVLGALALTAALVAGPAAARSATPASGTLSESNPVLSFSGTTPAGVNPIGDTGRYPCLNASVECDRFQATITLSDAYLAAHPQARIRVTLNWEFAEDDYDLYVTKAAGGEVVAASATDNSPEMVEIPAAAGSVTYNVDIVPYTAYLNSYSGTVELLSGSEGGGGGGGGGAGGGGSAAAPADIDAPRVVVAVIDTGINPYHAHYRAGSAIYPPGHPPHAVTLPVLAEFGIASKPECWITLTRTGDAQADYDADVASGLWDRAAQCDVVWFTGTNILAKTFSPGGRPYLPNSESDTHGVGTSSAVLAANPDAVLLFLEGTSTAAEEYAMTHPAVDIISTSYGPIGSLPIPEHLGKSFTGTYQYGKLHFGACDNSPSTAMQDGTCGPWWSVGIAGIEETQDNEPHSSSTGRQPMSGTFPDFIADFTQTLPYCAYCQDRYDDDVGGTSFATPRSAGTASKVLLAARQLLDYRGGVFRGPGGNLMAAGRVDGRTVAFSNWRLRRALEEAAWVPGLDDYDPTAAPSEFLPGYPIPPVAPWAFIGWGVLSPRPDTGVVARSLTQLGVLTGSVPAKDAGFCQFQNGLIAVRKFYWDYVAVLSETYLDPPSPDPYLYCDSAAALLADVDDTPQDSDGDGIADATDNCPTVANASQADADADGIGDACDSDTGGGGGGNDPLAVTLSASHSKPANADGSYTVNGSDPLIVTFTAAASGGPDANYRYTFNFGDGSYAGPQSANSAQHSYAYANQDGYRVTVVVTDASATQSAVSNTILIRTTTQVIVTGNNGTVASLVVNPTSGTAPLTVTADATGSTHASGTVSTDYVFDFGEGAPVTNGSGTASHVYTVPQQQTYTVRVTVTDKDGSGAVLGSATATQDVVVNPGNRLTALLSVNPTTADVGQIITFDGCHSFAGDGHSITRYTLDPGDGTPVIVHDVTAPVSCANGHNDASVFQHAYGQGGSYTPTLTVYDETGAFAKASAGGVTIRTVPGPGTGGTSNSGVAPRRGGGALGWITLLPLALAGLRRRKDARRRLRVGETPTA